jgi:hypothetical protein
MRKPLRAKQLMEVTNNDIDASKSNLLVNVGVPNGAESQ